MSLGADAHFDKPISRDALLATLRDLDGARSEGHVALIIDDDPAARYVIRRSVRARWFEEAADGPTGIAAATRMRPEVIFLDLSMPGMNGSEVLEHLRTDPQTAGIPVVVVTSHVLDEGLRSSLAHARAFVQKKDISVETLASTLAALQLRSPPP